MSQIEKPTNRWNRPRSRSVALALVLPVVVASGAGGAQAVAAGSSTPAASAARPFDQLTPAQVAFRREHGPEVYPKARRDRAGDWVRVNSHARLSRIQAVACDGRPLRQVIPEATDPQITDRNPGEHDTLIVQCAPRR